MSEPATALGGAEYQGYVTVRELGPQGMITLRGHLSEEGEGFATILHDVCGVAVPGTRAIETGPQGRALAWMSPDELMLLCARDEAGALAAQLAEALAEQHALALDISDARAMFELQGRGLREVLMKLAPVDLRPGTFKPGEFRRTRLTQVPAAFWMPDETTLRLVCFRSVARYVFDLLGSAARPGSEVGWG